MFSSVILKGTIPTQNPQKVLQNNGSEGSVALQHFLMKHSNRSRRHNVMHHWQQVQWPFNFGPCARTTLLRYYAYIEYWPDKKGRVNTIEQLEPEVKATPQGP